MNHMLQLAADATLAVYVMASPDASEIEFLNLKPMVSDSERESLAARWPGRDLRGVGVIGRLADGRINMALKVPFDHIQLAGQNSTFEKWYESAPFFVGEFISPAIYRNTCIEKYFSSFNIA